MAKSTTVEKQVKIVGRDKREVDPDLVYTLARCGTPYAMIARQLGIKESTLKYNFRTELDKGTADLEQTLRMKQIEVALDGNVTMLIWLGKNVLGQSDSPAGSGSEGPLPWSDDDESDDNDVDDDEDIADGSQAEG